MNLPPISDTDTFDKRLTTAQCLYGLKRKQAENLA